MRDPRYPAHVAIIMDGNGRWATRRSLPRTEGHRQGLAAAKRIVAAACDVGISYLSLYTFSTENWKRTQEEVSFLMNLIMGHLSAELDFYRDKKVRVVHSGNRVGLAPRLLEEIDSVVRDTAKFESLTVNLAINYGGRDEILRAFKRMTDQEPDHVHARLVEGADPGFASFLDLPAMPDPDLIIRTGGEQRLSNFLLWQSAYSELYFCDTLWPDFSKSDFIKALEDFAKRDRKFGGIK
jgi:undecaprenyl diphosphate synthase